MNNSKLKQLQKLPVKKESNVDIRAGHTPMAKTKTQKIAKDIATFPLDELFIFNFASYRPRGKWRESEIINENLTKTVNFAAFFTRDR